MYIYVNRLDKTMDNYYSSVALFHYGGCLRVVLNYETKSKCNERNETKRNEILRNATKYTKMRNETKIY
jgi:hypothetical protein